MNSGALIQTTIQDAFGRKNRIYKIEDHLLAAVNWLERAQDVNDDGGVAAWYSLFSGWRPSYIETTGYIIETFLHLAEVLKNPSYTKRALKMADFLIDQQLPSGGLRSHTKAQRLESYPTVFDTGQDIIGLCDAYEVTKEKKYLIAASRAADFLCSIQENDGQWLKYTFQNTTHTYHSRVAYPICRVYTLTQNKKYLLAAQHFFSWAEKQQLENGWFEHNALFVNNTQTSHTHTIAYAIEGFLYAGLTLHDSKLVKIALKSALPPLQYFLKHMSLPARFNSRWHGEDSFMCLTGNAQFAVIWWELYKLTGYKPFLQGAKRMNRLLMSIQDIYSVHTGVCGAIKGSYPIYGDLLQNTGYCRYAYLNWATKFFVDALLLEMTI